MPALVRLAPVDVLRVLHVASAGLAAHAPGIDRLDVYPEPDGDCGANLAATMAGLVDGLGGAATFGAMAGRVSGSEPVVGRSGAVLVAVVGGFLDACRNADDIDADRFAIGWEVAAEQLAATVGDDVAVLAVVRAAADGALACVDAGGALPEVTLAAADAALDALEATVAGHPELARHGVVDAAGAGMVVVLDAFAGVTTGELDDGGDDLDDPDADLDGTRGADTARVGRYRVGFELAVPSDAVDRLAAVLATIGVDLVVEPFADGAGAVVAVSTSDIGAVIEAALGVGRPSRIRVDDLAAHRWGRDGG